MTVSAANASDVAGALRVLLEERHGAEVSVAEPATSVGDGLSNHIHLVRFAGETLPPEWARPLIVRAQRDSDALELARREARIHDWAGNRGYPVPQVLEVFAPGELLDTPTQVLERVPGRMALDEITAAPWRVRRVLTRMAELQARLHRLDPAGFPEDEAGDLADRRLSLVRETVSETNHAALARGLDRAETLLPKLRAAPAVACHGDYHPLNVLVDGSDQYVLDWTDAGLGDLHGDVARSATLFRVARIAANSTAERWVLTAAAPLLARSYVRAYAHHNPLDPERLALWEPLHLLHGWSQVVGLHGGQFDDGSGDDYRTTRVPEALAPTLERWFDDAMNRVG